MNSMGKLDKKDLVNISKYLKLATKTGKKVNYDILGIKDGRVYSTDGLIMFSMPIELLGEFAILKRDWHVIIKMGEGELLVSDTRVKFITEGRGYVFPLWNSNYIDYNLPFLGSTVAGFNAVKGRLLAAIVLAQSILKCKGIMIYIELNSKDSCLNMFSASEDKDWFHTIHCKVKGNVLIKVAADDMTKLLGLLSEVRVKFIVRESGETVRLVVNNYNAVRSLTIDYNKELIGMSQRYSTVKKYINRV